MREIKSAHEPETHERRAESNRSALETAIIILQNVVAVNREYKIRPTASHTVVGLFVLQKMYGGNLYGKWRIQKEKGLFFTG